MIKNFKDINEFRFLTKLSVSSFCKANKINRGSWWKWERGIQKPSLVQLEKLNKQYEKFIEGIKSGNKCKEITDVYKRINSMADVETKQKNLSSNLALKVCWWIFLIGAFLFIISGEN